MGWGMRWLLGEKRCGGGALTLAPSPLVGEGWGGGWPHMHEQAAPPSLSLPLKGGGNDRAATRNAGRADLSAVARSAKADQS